MYIERNDELPDNLPDTPQDFQAEDLRFSAPLAPPPGRRRKSFLLGLGSMLACGLVAITIFLTLSHHVRSTYHRVYGKPTPPRIDAEAAKGRLHQAAKTDLAFPFPAPRIIVCQEFSELDLFSGERFVKRYKVKLGQAPRGTYAISTHELPRGRDTLVLGLTPAPLATSLAAPAARVSPVATPAQPAAPTATAPSSDSGALSIQGLGPMEHFTGAVGLSENEAAELFVATQPGSPVTIEQ